MGLDLYLDTDLGIEEEENLIYWRKANFIYRFFDEIIGGGVQNGVYHIVKRTDIEDLMDKCEAALLVWNSIANQKLRDTLCETILPTCSGFFFGSTEYNEIYRNNLQYTYNELAKVLCNSAKETFKFFVSY